MSNDGQCPIWGTAAERSRDGARDGVNVDSPRAGGKYFISGTAKALLPSRNDSVKARLTTWLIDQHDLGTEWPEISSPTIELVERGKPLPVHERTDRLLKYLEQKSPAVGRPVECKISNQTDHTLMEMLAWSESLSVDEMLFLAEYLAHRGWIDKSRNAMGKFMPIITVDGYARLAELATKRVNSLQGFVAMWFPNKENADYDLINNAYNKGIYVGIDQAGYTPYRVDRDEHNDQITDKIISEIRRSKFLVADFTHGDVGARGGVYYEAGFAYGLNIPVIYTCLEKRFSAERIHFDISHQNFILWETPEDLREKLKNRITGSEIGWGPRPLPVVE